MHRIVSKNVQVIKHQKVNRLKVLDMHCELSTRISQSILMERKNFKGNGKCSGGMLRYLLLLMLKREKCTLQDNIKIDCIHMGFKAEWQKQQSRHVHVMPLCVCVFLNHYTVTYTPSVKGL